MKNRTHIAEMAIIQSKLKPLYELLAIKELPNVKKVIDRLEGRLEKIRRITT